MKHLLALLLTCLTAKGADVTFPIYRFTTQPATNRTVVITPVDLNPPTNTVADYTVISFKTGNSGEFTVTNMMAGLYQCCIQATTQPGPEQNCFNILVPSTNATLYADALLVVATNKTTVSSRWAYPASVSDARYAAAGSGGGWTNGTFQGITNHQANVNLTQPFRLSKTSTNTTPYWLEWINDNNKLYFQSSGTSPRPITFDPQGTVTASAFVGDISGAFGTLDGGIIAPGSIPAVNLPQLYSGTPGTLNIQHVGYDYFFYASGGGTNGGGGNLSALLAGTNAVVYQSGTNWVVAAMTDTNIVSRMATNTAFYVVTNSGRNQVVGVVTNDVGVLVLVTNIAKAQAVNTSGMQPYDTNLTALATLGPVANGAAWTNLSAWSAIVPSTKQNTLGFQPATNANTWHVTDGIPITNGQSGVTLSGTFSGTVSGLSLSNVQWAASPGLSNWVASNGSLIYSNAITGAVTILDTNMVSWTTNGATWTVRSNGNYVASGVVRAGSFLGTVYGSNVSGSLPATTVAPNTQTAGLALGTDGNSRLWTNLLSGVSIGGQAGTVASIAGNTLSASQVTAAIGGTPITNNYADNLAVTGSVSAGGGFIGAAAKTNSVLVDAATKETLVWTNYNGSSTQPFLQFIGTNTDIRHFGTVNSSGYALDVQFWQKHGGPYDSMSPELVINTHPGSLCSYHSWIQWGAPFASQIYGPCCEYYNPQRAPYVKGGVTNQYLGDCANLVLYHSKIWTNQSLSPTLSDWNNTNWLSAGSMTALSGYDGWKAPATLFRTTSTNGTAAWVWYDFFDSLNVGGQTATAYRNYDSAVERLRISTAPDADNMAALTVVGAVAAKSFSGKQTSMNLTGSTAALDFTKGAAVHLTNLSATACSFYITNTLNMQLAATDNYEQRVFFIHSGAGLNVAFPPAWAWVDPLTTTNLAVAQLLRLQVDVTGRYDSNVVASAKIVTDPTYSIPVIDSDVLNYLGRVGQVFPYATTNALNVLAGTLKSSGVWSNLSCFYPFLGTTGTAAGQNLINNNYNVAFTGAFSYSTNGINAPDQTVSAYANTGWTNTGANMTLFASLANNHTNYVGGNWYYVMGAMGASNSQVAIYDNFGTGFLAGRAANTSCGMLQSSVAFPAFTMTTRSAYTNAAFYMNTASPATTTCTSNTPPAYPVAIGSQNNSGSYSDYGWNGRITTVALGNVALSSAQYQTLTNAVGSLNSALSR